MTASSQPPIRVAGRKTESESGSMAEPPVRDLGANPTRWDRDDREQPARPNADRSRQESDHVDSEQVDREQHRREAFEMEFVEAEEIADAEPVVGEEVRDAVTGDKGSIAASVECNPASAVESAPQRRHLIARTLFGALRVWEWCFGAASLLFGLAVLATFPVVQLLSLGYLLEASGRVSRSGRLRDGFVGVRKAARIGSIVAGTWLVLVPVRIVSSLWHDAQRIDPGGPVARNWRLGLLILTVMAVSHIAWAWYRGGRLRHFLWPAPILFLRRMIGGFHYSEVRDAVWDFVVSLRLPYYFMLGLKGFLGAIAWLLVPALMLMGSTHLQEGPAAALVGLVGAFVFGTTILYLPFLQAHFAAERRMRAMFEWQSVRMQFRRAPIAYWFALLITLLFAIPLFLLKIETVPEQVAWLPSVFFVAFIFPARLMTGWAVGRARHHDRPRFFLFRWMARFAAIPIVAFYVLIVYITQFTSWNGAWNVLEQHPFLVPVPFLGL